MPISVLHLLDYHKGKIYYGYKLIYFFLIKHRFVSDYLETFKIFYSSNSYILQIKIDKCNFIECSIQTSQYLNSKNKKIWRLNSIQTVKVLAYISRKSTQRISTSYKN